MKLSVQKNLQKGFTLIELLVVIGILGILAAALVATIDPFEQLNKGTDARVENTVIETQNALLRYYTIKGKMPWGADPGDECMGVGTTPAGNSLMPGDIDATGMEACITSLIDQGEIRSSFANSADLDEIFVTVPDPVADPNNSVICYMPVSKAKQNDPNTAFDETGALGTDCITNDGETACYWCSGDVEQAP